MIKKGLLMVIQLGWWQRLLNIGQGPFMAYDLTGAPHTSLAQVGMVDLVRRAVGPQRTH